MRVVLDANIFVSALIGIKGHASRAVDAAFAKGFDLVTSDHILSELERTLNVPSVARRTSLVGAWQSGHIGRLRDISTIVEPDTSATGTVRDPSDDAVLGTALAAEVDYLVTGDQDLLTLGSYRGIEIVTPARFLAILDEQDTR